VNSLWDAVAWILCALSCAAPKIVDFHRVSHGKFACGNLEGNLLLCIDAKPQILLFFAVNFVTQLHNIMECLVSETGVFGFPFAARVMVSLPHRVSHEAWPELNSRFRLVFRSNCPKSPDSLIGMQSRVACGSIQCQT
jgi:hypothetical protein